MSPLVFNLYDRLLSENLLKSRIDVIRQKMVVYWRASRFEHYTYQNDAVTKITENILNSVLAFGPENKLSSDEVFILLAACWLYEIGLQPPVFSSDKYGLSKTIDYLTLERIRREKHFLAEKIIYDSLDVNYSGPTFGFQGVYDEYALLVAKICRWCSNESIQNIPEDDFLNGRTIRIKLLVCILRLANQLHMGSGRINWQYTKSAIISLPAKAKIWAAQFAQFTPLAGGVISFSYKIPKNLAELLSIDKYRELTESAFKYETNQLLPYLASEHGLHLLPPLKDCTISQIPRRTLDAVDIQIVEYLQAGVQIPEKAGVLIITANEIESSFVLKVFNPDGKIIKAFIGEKTYFYLGKVNGTEVFMVQSEMGSAVIGGSMETTLEGINALSPQYIIMVGIAFGVDKNRQSIGEILISNRISFYDLQKIATTINGKNKIIPRGDRPHASRILIDRFMSSIHEWKGAAVSFGLILSGEKLVDNIDFREQIKALEPEAIGGEMEATGVYLAANKKKVDWIILKAICDWADGNKSENEPEQQKLAASNAAKFVYHVINQGGLANKRDIL